MQKEILFWKPIFRTTISLGIGSLRSGLIFGKPFSNSRRLAVAAPPQRRPPRRRLVHPLAARTGRRWIARRKSAFNTCPALSPFRVLVNNGRAIYEGQRWRRKTRLCTGKKIAGWRIENELARRSVKNSFGCGRKCTPSAGGNARAAALNAERMKVQSTFLSTSRPISPHVLPDSSPVRLQRTFLYILCGLGD